MGNVHADDLLRDLRTVVEDVEALLRATAGQVGEQGQEARTRAEQSVQHARLRLKTIEEEVVGKVRDVAHNADRYVHENPWQSIGIGAGLAFVLGWLFSRR